MARRVNLFPLKARTATESSLVAKTGNAVGALVLINVTAVSATPSVVFSVKGLDETNALNTQYEILASAAITGTGLTVLRIHPQLTAATNTIAKDVVPSAIQVVATHSDTDSITYAVSVCLIDG